MFADLVDIGWSAGLVQSVVHVVQLHKIRVSAAAYCSVHGSHYLGCPHLRSL